MLEGGRSDLRAGGAERLSWGRGVSLAGHAGRARQQLDAGQLAALREVGREWDRVPASPQAWREALPVDPALGEYPDASEFRPARLTKLAPVAGRDGQLPPIETPRAAEERQTAAGRSARACGGWSKACRWRPARSRWSGCASWWRCRCCRPTRCRRWPTGRRRCWSSWCLAGLPGLSASLPVGVSYRQTIRAYPPGG